MKCKATILLLLTTACTPAEVQIAEEVIHEASVAENAIEQDLECPGCQNQQKGMPLPAPANSDVKLQQQPTVTK